MQDVQHKLLQEVLADEEGFGYFLEFLDILPHWHSKTLITLWDSIRCAENLFFWKEIQFYRSLWNIYKSAKDDSQKAEDEQKHKASINSKAVDIYEMYQVQNVLLMLQIFSKWQSV